MKYFSPISSIKSGFILAMVLTSPFVAFTQLASKSDLSITSIKIADDVQGRNGINPNVKTTFANLKCTIIIRNDAGHMAFQPKLVVILPEFITLLSVSNTYVRFSTMGDRGWPGTLLIDFDNIPVGGEKIVEFTFTRSINANTIGAYVFSGCPDPNPSNNSKEATY